ncbi:FAD-dependent pyridine nucleotide-disulfide oxidoreductase [Magnetococcus marinus MC-1]|uniref:FAD-dependent pyridine nucleotide-disulfide oxidoreductase n=1 Tax=Magnetococcus marinus (strain ATCC BAA-1437 / JCM 17883 / MC-1) TaxID=156889 RepID=A0LCR7_MAGMM|nr:FAD-dependent oxidoreductase [Magnetococcus marinus]ABK45760.1 FAD-dependent pyridine nucleotide-disulfide oxidoreductase [Magnetococcus marinus MC-1]
MNRLVIIGTGLAGYGLAKELRKRQDKRPITLISSDDGASYSKPMLSSALAQNKDAAALVMASAEQMMAQLEAEIITHTQVEQLDTAARTLQLSSGQSIVYHTLVLAVGANPIQLPLQGSGAAEVMQVNSLADYARWRTRLQGVERVMVIGPGLIGCEFANDLLKVGKQVSLIGPDPWPISALIPEAAGRAVQQRLAEAGATWHLETFNGAIEKSAQGFVTELKNGQVVEGDLVLSAVGLRPNIALAQAAGLAVNRGIVTDAYLQTSDPHIYALGDCAEVEGRNLPYVQPLMVAGRALAATLSGEATAVVYPLMPVAIKTSLHPVVTLPVGKMEGRWALSQGEDGVLGRFFDQQERLQGFVLTGSNAALKGQLLKEMEERAAS